MSLQKVTLAANDATLTGVAEFSASGILPLRITNGGSYDVSVVTPISPYGVWLDPDDLHFWIITRNNILRYTLIDGTNDYSYDPSPSFFNHGVSIDGDNFYAVNDDKELIIGTFSTGTVANSGKVFGSGIFGQSVAKVPGADLVYYTYTGFYGIEEYDISGASPVLTRTIPPAPFNATFIDAPIEIACNSTHLFYVTGQWVHCYRRSDHRYEGGIEAAALLGNREARGVVPLTGAVAEICTLTRGNPTFIGTWNVIDQDTETSFSAAGLPIAIPDDSSVDIPIVVTGLGTIDGLSVSFSSTDHTYIGDLRITLIHPNGTDSYEIWDSEGGGKDGLVIDRLDFSERFRGLAANGTWTLRIEDRFSGDTGDCQVASLHFNTGGGIDTGLLLPDEGLNNFDGMQPPYDYNATRTLVVNPKDTIATEEVRAVGAIAATDPGDAQWSYTPPSARTLKGIVLDGDLSRESNTSAASRKTILSYAVGTSPPGAWTEIRPGESLNVDVAEGETIYVKVDLDPDGGDAPWLTDAYLILDDLSVATYEGTITATVLTEAEVTP